MLQRFDKRGAAWRATRAKMVAQILQFHFSLLAAAFVAAENHAAGAGLQYAGCGDVHLPVDVFSSRLYDHRGAVVEIADPLPRLFTRFDNADFNLLTRQEGGLQGTRGTRGQAGIRD